MGSEPRFVSIFTVSERQPRNGLVDSFYCVNWTELATAYAAMKLRGDPLSAAPAIIRRTHEALLVITRRGRLASDVVGPFKITSSSEMRRESINRVLQAHARSRTLNDFLKTIRVKNASALTAAIKWEEEQKTP